MGLFNRESKEEKEQKQLQEFMERFQLEDLDEKDLVVLERIALDLSGLGLMKFGVVFSSTSSENMLKIGYLSALVEQNWMIIRQLSRLNKTLENLKIE